MPVVSFLQWRLTFSSPEYSWLTCYASYLLSHAKSDDMKSLPPYSGDKTRLVKLIKLQFNLSIKATLGTEDRDRCREVAVFERFKQESVLELSAKKKWPLWRGGRMTDPATGQRPVEPPNEKCNIVH